MQRVLEWCNARFPLLVLWKKHFSDYYVPKNLNFLYCFGAIALVLLFNQVLSGLWLTMFYTPSADKAFSSIEYLMRDVSFGWLFRYLHSTGASALFIVLYLHLFRGLLYGSYQRPRELVWLVGMSLYFLLVLEAFCGYLLPWGQMSYWGAQVFTSLVRVIPYIGDNLVLWLRGDYAVSDVTLHRFFALHVIAIPLLVLFATVIHVMALRHVGSNNPEGIDINQILDNKGKPIDGIPFHPYYTMKDFLGILVFATLFFSVVFFTPDMGGYFLDATNFTPANPLVTPDDIVPMWYMAPFYSILRAIPNQCIGIGLMMVALFFLLLLPWLDKSPVRSMRYRGRWSRLFLSLFVLSFIGLGYLGTIPVTPWRLMSARLCIMVYFSYFMLMPFYTKLESCSLVPSRIMR